MEIVGFRGIILQEKFPRYSFFLGARGELYTYIFELLLSSPLVWLVVLPGFGLDGRWDTH